MADGKESAAVTSSAADPAPPSPAPTSLAPTSPVATNPAPTNPERGKTVHGEAANAGHRVLAPDDAEVEAYLETALNAPAPSRTATDAPTATGAPGTVAVLDFGSQFEIGRAHV